jgi:Ca2+-transporting ATPase
VGEAITYRGLSEEEAAARLKTDGFNELPSPPRRNLFRIALEVGSEPMFELLLFAAAIYFLLGDHGEALMLGVSALGTVAIAVFQEDKTERVIESLRDLTSPRALVIREQIRKRIPGREVVRGDIVVLTEGDRVPADALLLSSNDLQADESLLTGESVPVRKAIGGLPAVPLRPGGDDLPMVFSGTMIVRGQGIGEVVAVGAASELGKIGKTIGEIKEESTPLHAQTRHLVKVLAAVGIALSVLMSVAYGMLRDSWLDGLLAGIALAMAVLPEELPIVLTIFLAMGAWRISKARVLTRRAAAIEALGAATVLCTDKTGTLTLNQMSIGELWTIDGVLNQAAEFSPALSEKACALIEFGILASEKDPADPMEKAIYSAGQELLADRGNLHSNWVLVHEYALSEDLFAMSHVWQAPGQLDKVVAAKGAPETIARMCHLGPSDTDQVRGAADRMAARGMRVLGVARAQFAGSRWPESQVEFAFQFLGLIGFTDPLRPQVRELIRECRAAGIRVVMVTGDYPATAQARADEAGLAISAGIVTGEEIAKISDQQLRERVQSISVFARIRPEQKLRIVRAFKANGEIVAMTGDGVNDAPSLKAANIGVAMGGRGTDVAREASSIVLLDDDLGSIVKAIRLGRRIHDNLSKAMSYLLAVHVPIAGLALLPLVLGWPIILAPVHIAFLELVIDPVCSIVFESEIEETDVMGRAPRDSHKPLFSLGLVRWSLFQGFWVFCLTAAIFGISLYHGSSAASARALVFASLVSGNFGLIFVNRSFSSSLFEALKRPNIALWLIFAATVSILGLAFAVPALREIFRFGTPHLDDLTISIGAGLVTILLLESIKRIKSVRFVQPIKVR